MGVRVRSVPRQHPDRSIGRLFEASVARSPLGLRQRFALFHEFAGPADRLFRFRGGRRMFPAHFARFGTERRGGRAGDVSRFRVTGFGNSSE
jgi:hypothetical protein